MSRLGRVRLKRVREREWQWMWAQWREELMAFKVPQRLYWSEWAL